MFTVDCFIDEPLVIEVIQYSDLYEGGKLLAFYETNAKDFLYPYPSYTTSYSTGDRQVLLDAALDFPVSIVEYLFDNPLCE